jgi:hypothetical protein
MQYLYLISCKSGFETFYKVGISNDVESRLAQLQTGNPLELSIEACYGFDNAEIVEKSIHQAWGKEKIRGEWFNVSGCEDKFHDICRLMNGEVFVPDNCETTEAEIEEAVSDGSKLDYSQMFDAGWRMETTSSKGKNGIYWAWRKSINGKRPYIYGGLIAELPFPMDEMKNKFSLVAEAK